ncbi:hypothetical protein CYLTODRAFT_322413, partial [Cylindrobasidium torrendii FP15055 ss-10]
CRIMQTECWDTEGRSIVLDDETVRRRVNGIDSKAKSNFDKRSHFSESEEQILLDSCLQLARRGFPVNHRRLAEEANIMLMARDGVQFKPVGSTWTARFRDRH